jgi:hypothetical protein
MDKEAIFFMLLAGAGLLGLGILIRWSATAANRHPPPSLPVQPIRVPGAAMDTIRSYLQQGRKINAIKELRQATGLGLREAKEAVEAIEAGREVPYLDLRESGGSLAARARRHKAAGDFSAAVVLVKAETGMTEAEATEFVTALDESTDA